MVQSATRVIVHRQTLQTVLTASCSALERHSPRSFSRVFFWPGQKKMEALSHHLVLMVLHACDVATLLRVSCSCRMLRAACGVLPARLDCSTRAVRPHVREHFVGVVRTFPNVRELDLSFCAVPEDLLHGLLPQLRHLAVLRASFRELDRLPATAELQHLEARPFFFSREMRGKKRTLWCRCGSVTSPGSRRLRIAPV